MTYIQPLTFIFVVMILIGLIGLRRCKGVLLPTVAAVALLLLSWPPVDWLLSRPLEASYPIQPFPSKPAQVIVVLSSSVDAPRSERPYALVDKDTFSRCEFAAWLHRNWKSLPVLACGGGRPPVSAAMRELLQRAGVPDSMILTEERSRSTHENAVYGTEILRKHGFTVIALVVEAYAMPRAEACFRRQGMDVAPAPSSFRTLGHVTDELLPTWKAIGRNEGTLHEVLGLAWYKLRGRI